MKQEHVRSNPEGGSYEDGTMPARSFQLGGWPNWSRVDPVRPSAELDWADGRAGCVVNPARRMAELVACSIQLGHSQSLTGSAWRMDERVVLSTKLGHPPSWTGSPRRMAELDWFTSADGRAGLVHLGGWPSWSRGRSSSAIHRAGRCALSTLQ
ncbi:hypothetical protein YC2023_089179 [Brassica napus]